MKFLLLLIAVALVSSEDVNYCKCGVVEGAFEDGWDPAGIWIDLIVVLDTSPTMKDYLEKAKTEVTSFVAQLSTNTDAEFFTRIGVISTTGKTAEVIYNLNMTSTDTLDKVTLSASDGNITAAFTAALNMFIHGEDSPAYSSCRRQVIYFAANTVPDLHPTPVHLFKSNGGIVIANQYLSTGEDADMTIKSVIASENFYFNSNDKMSAVQFLGIFCEANCFCDATRHPFNDDSISPRTEGNRGCFRAFDVGIPQVAARQLCESENATLVSIHDQDKEFFVSAVVANFGSKKKYWIGYEYVDEEWKWDDQSSDDFSDWAPDQPDTTGEQFCVYATQRTGFTVRWSTTKCDMGGIIDVCESAPNSRGYRSCVSDWNG